MGHIREDVLERFLLEPAAIDAEDREAIRAHLAGCQACTAVLEYLRDFHQRLEKTGRSLPPRANSFIDSLAPAAAVIPLRPFTYQPETLPADVKYTTVLAAMAETAAAQRYRVLTTLAAEDQETLVRIVLDQATGRVSIYLHAADQKRKEFAIVSMPELGLDFVCDQNGQLDIPAPPSLLSADLSTCGATLRTPVRRLDLEPADFAPHPDFGGMCERRLGDQMVRLCYHEGELSIECAKQPPGPCHQALVDPGGGAVPLLVGLSEGSGRCALRSLPEHLVVRLYQ